MLKKNLKHTLFIVLALAIAFTVMGCGSAKPPAANTGTPAPGSTENVETGDGSLNRVLNAGKLIVGCETAWPPFAYMDGDQKLVGFDVEVAAEVAKRLGVEISYSSSNSWDWKFRPMSKVKVPVKMGV